jgi:hypothetical protein
MGPPAPPRTSPPSPHETKHDVNTFESFESFQSEEMPKYYPGDAEEYIIAINSLPAFKPTDPTRPMTFSEIEKVHENSLSDPLSSTILGYGTFSLSFSSILP